MDKVQQEQFNKYLSLARQIIFTWPEWKKNILISYDELAEFPAGVVSIVIREQIVKINEKNKLEKFHKHLDWASKIVASWPEWKRNILGNSVSPQNLKEKK